VHALVPQLSETLRWRCDCLVPSNSVSRSGGLRFRFFLEFLLNPFVEGGLRRLILLVIRGLLDFWLLLGQLQRFLVRRRRHFLFRNEVLLLLGRPDLVDLRHLSLHLHFLLEFEFVLEFFLLLAQLLLNLLKETWLSEIKLLRLFAGHHELTGVLLVLVLLLGLSELRRVWELVEALFH